ncbi:hypothetical protein, partial [[Flexibacter] sp. ATCC 35208]|uniref:hypothetical protein n=1 Tax=[Flexibacter] sp. ATCC 35208 TaxID=1936242 RepID=UPI0009C9C38C
KQLQYKISVFERQIMDVFDMAGFNGLRPAGNASLYVKIKNLHERRNSPMGMKTIFRIKREIHQRG